MILRKFLGLSPHPARAPSTTIIPRLVADRLILTGLFHEHLMSKTPGPQTNSRVPRTPPVPTRGEL